jgi:2'-5' RNA ligase
VADGTQRTLRFLAHEQGRLAASKAVRRDTKFVGNATATRFDGWGEDANAGALTEWLAADLAVAAPDFASPPTIPPCSITYGTNEYGTLVTTFHFEGDASPWTVVPAMELDDITNEYMLGFFAWSRDPRDELLDANGNELPECPIDRADFGANSAVVILPIPADIAATFPGTAQSPHVTMLYVPEIDPAKVNELALVVADELGVRWSTLGCEGGEHEGGWHWQHLGSAEPAELSLAGLNYFDHDDKRVAYAAVTVPSDFGDVRRRIESRLSNLGIETARKGETWVPHATLSIMPTGTAYEGTVPTGSWKPTTLEIWCANDSVHFLIGHGSTSGVDKLELVGSKWHAFRNAGRTLVGKYDTEAEARAGLAADAVDRALTGRYDLAEPDETTIKAWLVEHISDNQKMPRPRMLVLKALEDRYPYLKPPVVDQVFRGLRNIEPSAVGRWSESSDPVQDKSWSAKREPAERFARGEWTLEAPIAGKSGVLLTAKADPAMLLLNPDLLAELPGVGDVIHPVWNEPLSKALRDEQEVLALDSLAIVSAEAVPMLAPKADAVHRRVDARSIRKDFGHRVLAVHTESRTNTFDIVRADRIELPLPNEHKPVVHPDGWVMYPVLYSRGNNIQVYDGVREFRPWAEVSKRASLDTFIGDPWELRHSRDLLNPDTVRGVARGCMVTAEPYQDGEHIFGWAKAWDRALLYAIEGDGISRPEAPEVSLAWRGRIHKQPGTDDYGNPFDQWVSDILVNSLASEPYGRAETARVLSVRADADDAITVHGADELLALARGAKLPASTIYYDSRSWTRFDSARSPRPLTTHHEDSTMLKNKLIAAARSLGLTDEVVAKAIGLKTEDLVAFMEGTDDLTPDQANALAMAFPDKPKAEPPAAAPPAAPAVKDDSEMVKVKIGEAEVEVPKVAAEHIAMLEGRSDRAGLRADKAENELRVTERELAIAKDESVKRADAMKSMVSHADAAKMLSDEALSISGSMELARRCHGYEWSPEARKDSASGEALPLSASDWHLAAIRSAFGDKADVVIARIDGARTPEARAYAIEMHLADAREILDRRDHKGPAAVKEIEVMRRHNAAADKSRQDGETDDELAKAREARYDYAEKQFVGAPTLTNGAS